MSSPNEYREMIQKMYDEVEMPGGWAFDTVGTLQDIDLAFNSQYRTGKLLPDGSYKFYFNVVVAPVEIGRKFTDLDFADFRLIPEPGTSDFRVWALQKDFKYWAKREKFSKILNDVGDDYPKYGHVVVKKTKKGVKKVPIHNLRVDPSVESMEKMPFVIEAIRMSRYEIEKMRFNKPEGIKELFDREEDSDYLVYDIYERCEDGWEHKVMADMWAKVENGAISRGTESLLNNQNNDWLPAVTLHEDTVKELPYREVKWEHVPGRWLGRGYVELLRDNQLATNEAENLERSGLAITSLTLLQTRDKSLGGQNVLRNAENGDIIGADQELTKVDLAERNLAAFNATRQRWDSNTNNVTFSTDIARGEDLPSRTPLGTASIQLSMVESFYKKKRENIGLFWRDIIFDWVIPSFREMSRKEHTLIFVDSEDKSEFIKFYIDAVIGDTYRRYTLKHGFNMSDEQRAFLKQKVESQLRSRQTLATKIPDGWYDDAKFFIDVVVTKDQLDVGLKSQTLQQAQQMLNTNPGILQNMTARQIFFGFLRLGGVSPQELKIDETQIDMTPMQPGGSTAATQAMPMQGTATV